MKGLRSKMLLLCSRGVVLHLFEGPGVIQVRRFTSFNNELLRLQLGQMRHIRNSMIEEGL